MRAEEGHSGRKRRRVPDRLVLILGAGFTLMALFSGWLVYGVVRDAVASWSETGLPGPFSPTGRGGDGGESGAFGEMTPLPTISLDDENRPKWNGSDRVNILLMGLDYRDWAEGDGPPRTDSMMLVTIDPVTKTAGMLSIPRDLWVEIPGFEHNRINTAYFLGETNRLPGGGPGLAMDTVENLLGVPIQYYALIEFHVFEEMIDEIGGVDVWVDEDLKISPIGEMSTWLEGGKGHHLDGAQALAYARARKTEGGDFDRAQRQQQLALAIKDKIFDLNMVPTLLSKAPSLYQRLASGIHTNLAFEEMISLGLLAVNVSNNEIRNGVISPPEMVLLETHPDGAQVLKPIPEKIRFLRDEIFTGTGALSPSIDTKDPLVGAVQEGARVAVYNGSGVEGLATETGDYLTEQGLNIVELANADRMDYDKSRIILHNQRFPYTVRYLSNLLNMSEGQVLTPVTPRDDVDVILILGVDWAYSDRP